VKQMKEFLRPLIEKREEKPQSTGLT